MAQYYYLIHRPYSDSVVPIMSLTTFFPLQPRILLNKFASVSKHVHIQLKNSRAVTDEILLFSEQFRGNRARPPPTPGPGPCSPPSVDSTWQEDPVTGRKLTELGRFPDFTPTSSVTLHVGPTPTASVSHLKKSPIPRCLGQSRAGGRCSVSGGFHPPSLTTCKFMGELHTFWLRKGSVPTDGKTNFKF